MRETGRLWLSPKENILDAASWSITAINFKDKITYGGNLTVKVGKNNIVIHSSNSSDDHRLKRFKNKILLISELLDYFLANSINYDGEDLVNRVWLNDEKSSDKLFTGSCVVVLNKEECLFELASCDRSNRWYVSPGDQNYSDRFDVTQLNLLKVALTETIKAIDLIVKSVKPKPKKAKKV